jgi:hypothetical protein
MANLKDLAIQLATTNLVADLVAEHKDQLRAEIAATFIENGSDSVKVTIGDDKIGKVTLVEPKLKATVSDDFLFTQWVESEHPSEIVAQVRDSFKKHVLDNVEILDDGTAVLKTTGEIVKGVTGRPSTPYVSTRFDSDGREKLGRALQDGKIAFALPTIANKQIPGGTNE